MTQSSGGEELLSLEKQICFALVRSARAIVAFYRPFLEPLNLTHPQYLVMLALWENSPLTVKDLSGALQLDSATLSPLLKRLELQGLLTRTRQSDDERKLSVALTPAGAELREQAKNIPRQILEKLGMSVAELDTLRAAVDGFSDRLTES